MKKKITIFGLGYVGCSLAVLLSQFNKVTAIDIDIKKVNDINNKKSPIKDNLVQNFLSKKNLMLKASSSMEFDDCDFFILAIPTNYDETLNYFDTSSLRELIKLIKNKFPNTPIIVKSTIPIGFIDEINLEYSCENIIFSPEFLREGSALDDNLNPSRIIIGSDSDEAVEFVQLLVNATSHKSIPTFYTGTREAESIKLFANTYLAMRVSFFNELDTFAHLKNLDTGSIIDGISSDLRIGNFYNNPSFGYGGYCLPKDTKQLLANSNNIPQKLLSAIVDANETRKDFIFSEVIKLKPKMVGIYLLAMKSNSDNFRSSAIHGIISRLKEKNIEICIFEPALNENYFLENIEVIDDLASFKDISDLIIANRYNEDLDDVKDKVFTRDVFGNN